MSHLRKRLLLEVKHKLVLKWYLNTFIFKFIFAHKTNFLTLIFGSFKIISIYIKRHECGSVGHSGKICKNQRLARQGDFS